jgi:hypothetical protein
MFPDRKTYTLILIFLLLFSPSQTQGINDTIHSAQLKSYLGILAADSMKGRKNYSEELYKCAGFIAKEFERFGLKKSAVLKSYFQPFTTKPESLGKTVADSILSPINAQNILLNVIGILPGKSKANEVVIFSAHYDHVGTDSGLRKDKVFNGANDNASGTAAVLTLANYFSLRNDNERTLVFCAFAGEELGLFGSEAFVNNTNTGGIKAVINIEMIGRTSVGKNAFFITGSDQSDFSSIIKKALRNTARLVREPPYEKELFKRSDNYPFAEKGIVAHTIMSSDDDDQYYHKTCDELERIDFENMTKIVQAIAIACQTMISGKETPKKF